MSIAVGLVLGLLTGFFFERRATRSANDQNAVLRDQIAALRTVVLSLGGDPDRLAATSAPAVDLIGAVRERALATQDASGRVRSQSIVAYFIDHGSPAADIDEAVEQLLAEGFMTREGRWLQIR
ncbi:carboxylesterase family protein [Miltoncostaea oceani]|uniref:carboxylesterase family protein n=1 Tax=Miltoncostaea oceani TaxID=2843216 RepID=UPI001C3C3D78|nr:carboxylesterase family protein [Miltoncostaea oceani]